MPERDELDIAYKYPFSDEAKKLIKELDLRSIEQGQIAMGKSRLEEALKNDRLEYKDTNYGKSEFVVSYVYARMLISALKNGYLIKKYADAEAKRSMEAMEKDSEKNIMKIVKELGLEMEVRSGTFVMGFAQFLNNMPTDADFGLSNQRLRNGMIEFDKNQAIRVIGVAMSRAIAAGLPIKHENLPKSVIEHSKSVKLPMQKIEYRARGGSVGWIDRLLETPIPDCRHRTVNLILAPYLMNIKGMPVDAATAVISNYIGLCKTVNPDTKITDRYIRYQCEYAKSHGFKPLSLRRARTELGAIDFNLIAGEETKD